MPLRNDPFYSATSLKTNDIMGCQTGTKGLGNFHTRTREQIRDFRTIDDIPGALSGSLKRGLVSPRRLNPLNPSYKIPGENIGAYSNKIL